ncbi:hypothetical protein HI802_18435 (plasmid) [Ralstonia solanacearum]|nr:hypothetical protein HI802_18435 [Ralstonia solanacearum]QKL99215.1 hypothetical protein HI801_18435 [Ralstonia solanacearum]QLR11585.1 hypothetical protein H1A20_19230 [Ralstonia solanacearum]
MAKVPEIKPKSFTEYVQEVERLNGSAEDPIWFRGAGKSSYELIPTLYRHSQKKTVHEIARRCCINQGRGEAVLTFTRNDMAVTL